MIYISNIILNLNFQYLYEQESGSFRTCGKDFNVGINLARFFSKKFIFGINVDFNLGEKKTQQHLSNEFVNDFNSSFNIYKYSLPILEITECPDINWQKADIDTILDSIVGYELETFKLHNYEAYPTIKAELSTGLKK